MQDTVSLFLELCSIPSPPGAERAVADHVTAYLRALGLEVEEDFSHSFRLRAGKIVEWQMYDSNAEAREAVGLDP